MQKITESFYDEFAHTYDSALLSDKVDYKIFLELSNIFKRQNISSGSILDLGCGTGLLKDFLGVNFNYTGVDISLEMLKRAEDRGYVIHKSDLFEFLILQKDDSFDHVVCTGALYWLPNVREIFSEMCRVAKLTVTATLEKISPIKEKHEEVIKGVSIYDHSEIILENLTEDYTFSAWTSPSTKDRVDSRIVFYKK